MTREATVTFIEGLRFPEGPVPLADGDVLVCEIAGGTLARVSAAGAITRIAALGGGPNGAAIGPDGRAYICNNGGFTWFEQDGLLFTDGSPSAAYAGGSIQAVDLATGAVETLYTHCGDHRLRGPNDIVFDAAGGFWFTDMGKVRARDMDRGAVYYAHPDGGTITEAIFPLTTPNGIGLAPDGGTLYVSETGPARLWAFEVTAPGRLALRPPPSPNGGWPVIPGLARYAMFDSLAVQEDGKVCVATLLDPGITRVDPADGAVEHIATPADPMTTNIAFGGPARRTAWVTLSMSGRLARLDWDASGLALPFG